MTLVEKLSLLKDCNLIIIMEEKIYFSNEDTFEIISEILGKNGIEETLDDASEKDDSENSFIITVLNLTEDFAKEKISEKDFVLSLEKQLKVSVQVAENIAKDIKGRILPGVEKIKVEKTEGKSESVNPVRLIKNDDNLSDNIKKQAQPDIKNIEETEKFIKKNLKKELRKTPKKSDSYRESTE